MGVEPGIAGGRVVPRRAAGARRRDHWFFTGMAAAAALAVFAGFAPTYYLKSVAGGRALSALVHLHAVVSSAWMLLFVAQTSLVTAGRTDVHRRLGIAGAALVPLIFVVGIVTAIEAARLGVTPPGGPPALNFLSVPLGTILAFGILAGLGLYYRRRPETHKRLMLLATIALLAPALARLRFLEGGGPPVAIGGTCLFVIASLAYDRTAHGRTHPALLWGGLLLMLSLPLRFAIGRTDAWLAVARWLTE